MTVRADTTVNVRGVTPADGSYQAGGGYRWLQLDCGGARLALHGDPADIAKALVWWAGLLLDGCDREGRAQVYRAAARLKDAYGGGIRVLRRRAGF